MTTKLRALTLPGSGRRVLIPKIPVSSLMLDLVRDRPKPDAPLQEVEIAGRKTAERNYAHPDYEKAVASWEQDMETAAGEIIVRRIARVNEVPEEDKPLVDEAREDLGELAAKQNDRLVWLKYVAAEDDDDFKALMQAVRTHGEPGEAAIGAVAEGFRS